MMRRQRVSGAQSGGGTAVANTAQTRQAQNATPQQKVAPNTPKQVQGSQLQKPAVQQQQGQASPLQKPATQQQKVAATPGPVPNVKPEVKVDMTQEANNQQQPQQMELSQESGIGSEPMQAAEGDEDALKGRRVRWFTSTKKPSVRAKERKIRQNRRLRKILLPKNALMALHEIKGINISEFAIDNRRDGGGFVAKVSVNNMQYEGIGNSKMAAKNAACEKALRDHIICKMLKKSLKPKTDESANNSQSIEGSNDNDEDVEMKDDDSEGKPAEDDIPMLNLAAFALHKLFSEWENEGFEIPEFRPHANSSSNGTSTPPPPNIKKELPANWESMHPTSLLCMMRPGIQYTYLGGEGQPPNTKQRVGISVDNQNFIGEGRSQKVARRNAAVDACNKIFNTNFTKD